MDGEWMSQAKVLAVSQLDLASAFLCLSPVGLSCQQRGAESPNHVNPDFFLMGVEAIQPLDFSLKGLLDHGALQGEMGVGCGWS